MSAKPHVTAACMRVAYPFPYQAGCLAPLRYYRVAYPGLCYLKWTVYMVTK